MKGEGGHYPSTRSAEELPREGTAVVEKRAG